MTDTKLAAQVEALELAARESMRALKLVLAMDEQSSVEQTQEDMELNGPRSFFVDLDWNARKQVEAAAKALEDLGVDLSVYSERRAVDMTIVDALAQKPLKAPEPAKTLDDELLSRSIAKMLQLDADFKAVSRQRDRLSDMLDARNEQNIEPIYEMPHEHQQDVENILTHLNRGLQLVAQEEDNKHLKSENQEENTLTIIRDDSTSFEIAVKVIAL